MQNKLIPEIGEIYFFERYQHPWEPLIERYIFTVIARSLYKKYFFLEKCDYFTVVSTGYSEFLNQKTHSTFIKQISADDLNYWINNNWIKKIKAI